MKGDKHYFIGINVPVSIAHQAENWAKELIPFPFKQWTYPDDYHITLQFLGFLDDKKGKADYALKRSSLLSFKFFAADRSVRCVRCV